MQQTTGGACAVGVKGSAKVRRFYKTDEECKELEGGDWATKLTIRTIVRCIKKNLTYRVDWLIGTMVLRSLAASPTTPSSLRRLMSKHRLILRPTLPRKRLHPTGAYCFPFLYRVSYIYDMDPVISVGREKGKKKEGGKEQVHEGQRKGKRQKVKAVLVVVVGGRGLVVPAALCDGRRTQRCVVR
jgi:hypothetical protein